MWHKHVLPAILIRRRVRKAECYGTEAAEIKPRCQGCIQVGHRCKSGVLGYIGRTLPLGSNLVTSSACCMRFLADLLGLAPHLAEESSTFQDSRSPGFQQGSAAPSPSPSSQRACGPSLALRITGGCNFFSECLPRSALVSEVLSDSGQIASPVVLHIRSPDVLPAGPPDAALSVCVLWLRTSETLRIAWECLDPDRSLCRQSSRPRL